MSTLAGQTAVITGGASGLGAALGQMFGAAKMAVVLVDIDGTKVEDAAASLRAAGVDALGIHADVSQPSTLTAAAAATEERFGACHVLCANVSVVQLKGLDDTTLEEWRWILGVNVLGTIATVNAFLPLMRRSHGERRVAITSSVAALRRTSHQGAYAASKAALTSYGDTLRNEVREEGIGVTIVFPHGMRTTHVESSTKVRPSDFGSAIDRPSLDVILQEMAGATDDIVSAEEAVQGILAELRDDVPYIITHGRTVRPAWHQRVADIEAAFDRMEARRDYPTEPNTSVVRGP